MVSYAQGFMLLREAAKEYQLEPELRRHRADVARRLHHPRRCSWAEIKKAFDKNPTLSNLLLDPYFKGVMERYQGAWRRAVAEAVTVGVPMPAFTTALAFFDGYRTERLPANLLQAQRDYFGAHTYERIDKPRGKFFHTNWTGQGRQRVVGDIHGLGEQHEHGPEYTTKKLRWIFSRWARWSTAWTPGSSRSARRRSARSTSAAASSTAPPTSPIVSA